MQKLRKLRRRRHSIALQVIMKNRRQKYKVENRLPNLVRVSDWGRVVDRINRIAINKPSLFKKMYRLHVDDFFALLNRIAPLITRTLKHRRRSVPVILKLAVSLRWLAGGSYLDLSFGYELPSNVIHEYIFEVLQAIDDSVDKIRFPLNSLHELEALESGNNFSDILIS